MVWTDSVEVRQAVDLLPLWVDIDVDDALELLGKEFDNRSVRSYAVNQLRKADDEVLAVHQFISISDRTVLLGFSAVFVAVSSGFEV